MRLQFVGRVRQTCERMTRLVHQTTSLLNSNLQTTAPPLLRHLAPFPFPPLLSSFQAIGSFKESPPTNSLRQSFSQPGRLIACKQAADTQPTIPPMVCGADRSSFLPHKPPGMMDACYHPFNVISLPLLPIPPPLPPCPGHWQFQGEAHLQTAGGNHSVCARGKAGNIPDCTQGQQPGQRGGESRHLMASIRLCC